jgi:NAD(P)-dependent dehydrogenase (short-subunit alcohol dehydrogenase family)
VHSFRRQIAIVTGGASGIGRALCLQLARDAAIVVVADIDLPRAQEVAVSIKQTGGHAEAAHVDVSRAAEVDRLVSHVIEAHGRLDLMFNNAAVAVVGDFLDTTQEHWRRVLEVNLHGVLHGSRAAYGVMKRQDAGHIINVASMVGLIPSPTMTPYSTSKWAIVGFSTALRAEAAEFGVNVSVACPGLVDTNIHERTDYLRIDKTKFLARLPPRFMQKPEHAATAILRGVKRNRAIIVDPWHARLVWRCYRWWPPLLNPLLRKMVRDFRNLQRAT